MRFHSQNPGSDHHSDDDDYGEDEDDKFFEDEDDYLYEESKDIKMAELSLVEANLNRRILVSAVRMCENSFWWRFCSHKNRLKMIQQSYKMFNNLISGNE